MINIDIKIANEEYIRILFSVSGFDTVVTIGLIDRDANKFIAHSYTGVARLKPEHEKDKDVEVGIRIAFSRAIECIKEINMKHNIDSLSKKLNKNIESIVLKLDSAYYDDDEANFRLKEYKIRRKEERDKHIKDNIDEESI